jgi:hypothetical protein
VHLRGNRSDECRVGGDRCLRHVEKVEL